MALKKYTIDDIPTWSFCNDKAGEAGYDSLDALEKFIYENEPSGLEATLQFRQMLVGVLNYVI